MKNLQTLFTLGAVVILSCNNGEKNNSAKIEATVFRNDTIRGSNLTGFGYNITVDGKPYVHQPHIPAASGLKGFQTQDDALKTGEFACKKFRMTNALPMITLQELDSLGIKY
jgi:hypothetical protein